MARHFQRLEVTRQRTIFTIQFEQWNRELSITGS
jgi:hypothetical protein